MECSLITNRSFRKEIKCEKGQKNSDSAEENVVKIKKTAEM